MKLFSKKNFCAGFTLIELLVIIAIIGVMAGAVVVAVNPLSKLNSAKLANVKTFSASVENALIMSQVGKWSFNDQANPGLDSSGYGNDGEVNGATLTNAQTCGLGFGSCMSFDGVGDRIVIPDNEKFNLINNFSIELWVRFNSIVNQESLMGKSSGGGAVPKWHFIQAADENYAFDASKTLFGFGSSGAVENKITWNNPLVAGSWYNMVIVRNDNIFRLYVNGSEVGTPQTNANAFLDVNSYLTIGSDGENWNFTNGLIDEVKIYNKALLSYQIQQLYAQGLVKHLLALK